MSTVAPHLLAVTAVVIFALSVRGEGERVAVKVGLLLPKENPYLLQKMGYATSAAAVSIALDRVNQEKLLPQVDWT